MFSAVCDKIKDKNTAFGYTHENCITFLTEVSQSVKRYGYKSQSHDANNKEILGGEEEILGADEDILKNTRSTSKKLAERLILHML